MNTRKRKLLSLYRPYLGLFIADMVCAFLIAGIALLLPLGARYITKDVLEGDLSAALPKIYQVGLIMVVLLVVQALCTFFVDSRGHAMGALMERDVRQELFEHYQKLSFSYYDEQKVGHAMSRLTNDSISLTEFFHHCPEDIMVNSVKFIGALVILLSINPKLALIVAVFLPFMAAYALFFNNRAHKVLRINKERISEVNGQVEDSLSGIRVVQSFANEPVENKRFSLINNRFMKSRMDGYRNEAYCYAGVEVFIQLIPIVVVVFGGAYIVGGSFDLADLVVFLLYVSYFTAPIQKLMHMTQQFQEGMTSFERFMDALETQPEIQDAKDAVELKNVRGNIQFRDVVFRYREDYGAVLEKVNLTVTAGEYIALVGPSGVGKTTLCSLIPRFYEVSEGSILLDGTDIRKVTLSSLRKNIGIVQQDVYLFSGTVLDNISYGRLDATEAEIIEAAKKANAHEFIMELPNGYQTDIGQRGVKLSGGQQQRLSIARAFLKNPPVLILDEATSALDNASEKIVQQSLEHLAENRTTFVIAHRLSTIRNAKRIIVLNEQGIAEQGTHEELMALGGTYAGLYRVNLKM